MSFATRERSVERACEADAERSLYISLIYRLVVGLQVLSSLNCPSRPKTIVVY